MNEYTWVYLGLSHKPPQKKISKHPVCFVGRIIHWMLINPSPVTIWYNTPMIQIHGLLQDGSISIANALDILKSYTGHRYLGHMLLLHEYATDKFILNLSPIIPRQFITWPKQTLLANVIFEMGVLSRISLLLRHHWDWGAWSIEMNNDKVDRIYWFCVNINNDKLLTKCNQSW